MKKSVLLVVALCMVALCGAQNRKSVEPLSVDFYGIDFSEVNVIGAAETSDKFITAFAGINRLMISEQKKYDVGSFLGYNVGMIDIDAALSQIEKLHEGQFINKRASGINIEGIIGSYPNVEGTYLLIIADELNKLTKTGTFVAVVFDGVSKQIISKQPLVGKARGFGLRNFWAGALHNGLKTANLTSKSYSN